MVADLPERFRCPACAARVINPAPTNMAVPADAVISVASLVETVLYPWNKGDKIVAAPTPICTNSANADEAVKPAHIATAMAKSPNVKKTPVGAPGVHIGERIKHKPSPILSQSCQDDQRRLLPMSASGTLPAGLESATYRLSVGQ